MFLKSLYSKLNTRVTVYRKLYFFSYFQNFVPIYNYIFNMVLIIFFPIYSLGRSFVYIGVTSCGIRMRRQREAATVTQHSMNQLRNQITIVYLSVTVSVASPHVASTVTEVCYRTYQQHEATSTCCNYGNMSLYDVKHLEIN